jgi:hypothetical protein
VTNTILSIAAAVLLAMLGYLIRGLLTWGRTIGEMNTQLTELTKKTDRTAAEVKEVREKMLSQRDLDVAVLNLKLDVMRGALGAGSRQPNKEGS